MVLLPEQIAARVQELRGILELTPENIASQIGVDTETYKKYESSQTDIPVGKLYKIAAVLGVDPTVLLMGEGPRMADYTIVRGGKGIDIQRFPGYKFSSLAYNYIGREMEPMIVTLEPGEDAPELVTHEGQEFNFVLDGRVGVIIRDREFELDVGDSIYFNPMLPHGQRALDNVSARFLTVINE